MYRDVDAEGNQHGEVMHPTSETQETILTIHFFVCRDDATLPPNTPRHRQTNVVAFVHEGVFFKSRATVFRSFGCFDRTLYSTPSLMTVAPDSDLN